MSYIYTDSILEENKVYKVQKVSKLSKDSKRFIGLPCTFKYVSNSTC